MIVALSGYAQSGKDTVADHLSEHHGFEKLGMNQILREACVALNPIVDAWSHTNGHEVRYTDALTLSDYENAKKNFPEFRAFMQRLGTEFAEAIGHPELWVALLLERTSRFEDYVFSSCRRWVEAEAIKRAGGLIVRVNRPGAAPANDHPSETEVDKWPFDITIANSGTLEDLYAQIDQLMDEQNLAESTK